MGIGQNEAPAIWAHSGGPLSDVLRAQRTALFRKFNAELGSIRLAWNVASDSSVGMELADAIVERLRQAGHTAYLVAGACATCCSGRRRRISTWRRRRGPTNCCGFFRGRIRWARILEWCWCMRAGAHVEVATFRSDLEYQEGGIRWRWISRPIRGRTRCGAISRSMLCCSIPSSGEVLDFTGGRADLEARLIRAIGDPERGSARIICGCCGRCVSRRGWDSRLKRKRSRRSGVWRR